VLDIACLLREHFRKKNGIESLALVRAEIRHRVCMQRYICYAVLMFASTLHSAVLLERTGPSTADCCSNGGVGIRWTQTSEWTDVDIDLFFVNRSAEEEVGRVLLRNSLVSGRSIGSDNLVDQLVLVQPGERVERVLSGQTLGAGAYYLIFAALSSLDLRVGFNPDVHVVETGLGVSIDASMFLSRPTGAEGTYWDEVPNQLLVRIQGTPANAAVAEPASAAMLLSGVAVCFLRSLLG
jgi:hypothetical protein